MLSRSLDSTHSRNFSTLSCPFKIRQKKSLLHKVRVRSVYTPHFSDPTCGNNIDQYVRVMLLKVAHKTLHPTFLTFHL